MSSYLRRDAERIRALVESESAAAEIDPVFFVYAVLMRAKGTAVTAADVHDAWAAAAEIGGKSSAHLVPWDALDGTTQQRDAPFLAAIRAAAAAGE
ncbi:MAG: hypothetical protein QOD07_1412 [Frankiaceae bacterium]|jgi:hypothetical protein|nr:hypothetical protein [Frankiaceae bacterium]